MLCTNTSSCDGTCLNQKAPEELSVGYTSSNRDSVCLFSQGKANEYGSQISHHDIPLSWSKLLINHCLQETAEGNTKESSQRVAGSNGSGNQSCPRRLEPVSLTSNSVLSDNSLLAAIAMIRKCERSITLPTVTFGSRCDILLTIKKQL